MTDKFYVYEHWRPDENVCFYVGKGTGNRAYVFRKQKANPHHWNIVRKLRLLGLNVEVKFIATNLTEERAFVLEQRHISKLKKAGVKLTNVTEGGGGLAGFEPWNKGKKMSPATRRKMSLAQKGKPKSELTKHKMSVAHIGQRLSETAKVKLSAVNKGRKWSDSTRAKMADAAMRRFIERYGHAFN